MFDACVQKYYISLTKNTAAFRTCGNLCKSCLSVNLCGLTVVYQKHHREFYRHTETYQLT